ncbi:hypothetical protein [Streptomyces sp. NPDC002588]|uniref:hypothetical protein n=1 Tax=Streptomyces sp. NPDC002588 TaxID=3154419 RepID=UPI00332FFEFC
MRTSTGWPALGIAVLGYLCVKTERSVRRRRRGRVQAAFEEIAGVPAAPDMRSAVVSLLFAVAGFALAWLGRDLPWPVSVTAGAVVGLAGRPEAACGVVVAGILGSGREQLLWAALSVLVGYGIRLVHLPIEWWRSPVAKFARISQYGLYIRPPSLADRFWCLVTLFTAAAPMAGVAAPERDGLLLAACAAALSTQIFIRDKAVAHEHRWGRRTQRLIMVFGNLAAVVAAAGPMGGWFASHWSQTGFLTGWQGGALICGVVFGIRALWPWRLGALTVVWLFPFWAVAVFHPGAGTAAALLPLLLAETGVACCVEPPVVARVVDRFAAWMIQQREERRLAFLGSWLYDGFVRHPGMTDFGLVRRYLGIAVYAARGGFVPGQSTCVDKNPELMRPLTGRAALRWTALATQALALVDNEIAPRVPEEPLGRERKVVEAELVLTTAIVLTYAEEWEDALREWCEAADRYKALGMRAEEGVCRAGAAHLLAGVLGRTEDARRQRARIDSQLPEPAWDAVDHRFRNVLHALSAHWQQEADGPRVEAS